MDTYSSLLSYLKTHQLANGSFENSPFQTLTILICLRHIRHNQTVQIIARNGINYLFSQACIRGTWNYWDRSDPLAQLLPDDLDDTAMALAAISIREPELINESLLLSFVNTLVGNETHDGGPYTTWNYYSKYYKPMHYYHFLSRWYKNDRG